MEDLPYLCPHAGAQRGVEVRERLVEQDEVGTGRERPGERHALLLSAGQFVRVTVTEAGQADEAECVPGTLRPARSPQPVADVARDRHVWEERVVLEDHAHPASLGRHENPRRGDRVPGEHDAPGVGPLEARQQSQEGGLPAPRRAEEGEDLTPRDLEGHPVHGHDLSVAFGELLADHGGARPGGEGLRRVEGAAVR